MPPCDSSETYMRAAWPEPLPAVLRLTFVAGISEVSRFSCMKFLGVSGVFDYAGLKRNSR
jgi:ABC-type transporter lipoprotein component MlaA